MEKARKKEITIEPIFWHYQKSKAGTCPIKLKVTADRKTKNYALLIDGQKLFLSKDDWDQVSSEGKIKKELKDLRDDINIVKANARSIARDITKADRPFSFGQFESKFFSNEKSTGFLWEFDAYLGKIFSEDRIGTYRTYRSAYDAFKAFLKDRDISPYEVTVELLKDFEKYLKTDREAGPTTVGIYARTLRIIYNICAEKDANLKQHYPFGTNQRGKFKISDSRKGSKKGDALSLDQIKKFVASTPELGSPQWEAKMYWLFSFYCQGMNFKDIAFLKFANVHTDVIKYTREKTKLTDDQEIIEIPITEPIREIFGLLANRRARKEQFVFPIIDDNETDLMKISGIVLQKIKTTNKWLKKLCESNALPVITTYWARHSYASLLKSSGVPVEMIRELLGHSDLRTTEHYLKRFDLSAKTAINKNLHALIN